MSPRIWLTLASLWGFMAVCAGAFGAHGVADPKAKAWLETGGHYQLIHALAVFACFAAWRLLQAPAAGVAAWLFLAGSLVFSGSLYLMAFGGPRALGAVTPIGGVLLLAGWAVLAWACFAGTQSGPQA
jgi:uncharacterized membrane protein YgdD (TMEM256/DUF423 family)